MGRRDRINGKSMRFLGVASGSRARVYVLFTRYHYELTRVFNERPRGRRSYAALPLLRSSCCCSERDREIGIGRCNGGSECALLFD